jgi:hypothetical protein
MVNCLLCQNRKAERECAKHSGKMLCTLCCSYTQSWENCPTICRYFKEEEGSQWYYHNIKLIPETGEAIKCSENCFLPNVYELISCNIEKLKIDFIDSHSINVSLTIILESPRDIIPEIYLKDSWKLKENWGRLDSLTSIHPLFFIFGNENGTFSLASTSIKINNKRTNLKQSLIHWNIWMPFSKKYFEDEKFKNSQTGKIEIKIFNNPQTGKIQTHTIPVGDGRFFRGKNLAIFSEIALNTPIEIETMIRYQRVQLVQWAKETQTHFGIFLPFKFIKSKDMKINPPPDLSIKKSEIKIYTPYKGKISQEKPVLISSENASKLVIGGEESIVDPYKEFSVNDFRFLHFKNKFDISTDVEAVVFVTSFPIPVSIYNSINKLPLVNFSIAKVIVTNFSNKSLKVTVISEIQGVSHPFEEDLVIHPWSQSELKITPSLIDEKIIELHSDTDANMSIKVESEGRSILRKNTPIKLLSKNTMIWDIEDLGMSWHIRLCDLVATWVTPNIPEISTIISDAAKVIGEILGPSSCKYGDRAIEKEVKALYDVISRDIRYVNRPFNFGPKDSMIKQRISTPKETLALKAGNCLDLSILFASCLESCDIEPLIVLIPGHAFVGWKGNILEYFIEATYMGKKDFNEAYKKGNEKYKKYFPKGGHHELINGPSRVIDIKEIRNKGILPIKF